MTIESLMTFIGFTVTIFVFGYTIGKDLSKKQK